MKPGEYILKSEPVMANEGRRTQRVIVRHTGDRPVQVGSHYHFYEVNNALDFAPHAALRLRAALGQIVTGPARQADLFC